MGHEPLPHPTNPLALRPAFTPHVDHDPKDEPEAKRPPKIVVAPHDTVPQYGTREHVQHGPTPFDPEVAMPPPRTIWQRYRQVIFGWFGDEDRPSVNAKCKKTRKSFLWHVLGPLYPLKPDLYMDAYQRPNPCPEEYIVQPHRWAMTTERNPKIPPPMDGKYNDYYHHFAFKHWLRRERDVYMAHCNLLHEMSLRCTLREGPINAPKNCRHLVNKFFAMSRIEELNQTLLYMSITGNVAIRETPYPADFVDQKRKIYDDWLFRTRMRKPGDPF